METFSENLKLLLFKFSISKNLSTNLFTKYFMVAKKLNQSKILRQIKKHFTRFVGNKPPLSSSNLRSSLFFSENVASK